MFNVLDESWQRRKLLRTEDVNLGNPESHNYLNCVNRRYNLQVLFIFGGRKILYVSGGVIIRKRNVALMSNVQINVIEIGESKRHLAAITLKQRLGL
ncbi:hypothetical protein BC937DRAFT_87524 [Endogone sp. FLAS-F59071]|nr:hypothetical protein BC937DRAFT_87524 [Endogone sp. FLAS-F59071]|eukprot:RUS19412.1 hypothetical protein BC937DRAFT_87524 [Endogone sp. FLAS-F59071]